MIIDCISDLHGHYPKLSGGHLLIVAGDLTSRDTPDQHNDFVEWLDSQGYCKKIVIAGNHDNNIDEDLINSLRNTSYLCDSGTEYQDLKIWGSPWTSWFLGVNPNCKAFMIRDYQLDSKWNKIPNDVDILITHSPPHGILDIISDNKSVGSFDLRKKVLSKDYFPNLKLHVFGHIHECGGKMFETTLTKFVNASHMNENYKPVNVPVRIILG